MTHPDTNNAAPPTAHPNPHTSDHLANERTFLAWIRTSIAIIGLGFVVAKFSVWLRELAVRLADPAPMHRTGLSLPMGVAMMISGGAIALLAAWRYHRVRRAIDTGAATAGGHTLTAVAILVLAIAAALVTYMLATG